jgi:outer membrane protein assembly factor BamB
MFHEVRALRNSLIVLAIATISATTQGQGAPPAPWEHALPDIENIEAISGGHFLLLDSKSAYRILDVKTGEIWLEGEKAKEERPVYPGSKPETLIIGSTEQYEIVDLAEKKSLGAGRVFSKFDCHVLGPDVFLLQLYSVSELTGQRTNLSLQSIKRSNGKNIWARIPYEEPVLNVKSSEDGTKTYLLTTEGLEAVNNADGQTVWAAKVPKAYSKLEVHGGEIIEQDGAVYVTQGGLTKIDPASGDVLWSNKYDVLIPAGSRSTQILSHSSAAPIITADAVYTSGKGKIRKFDQATGKKLWESSNYEAVPVLQLDGEQVRFVGGGIFTPVDGPDVSGQSKVCQSLPQLQRNAGFRQLDASSVWLGKPVVGALNASTGKVEYAVEGKKQFVGVLPTEDGWLLADDAGITRVAADGATESLYQYKDVKVGNKRRLVAFGADYVLCGKDGVARLNLQSEAPAWTAKLKKFHLLGVTDSNIIGFSDKQLVVIDGDTGEVSDSVELPNDQWAASMQGKFIAYENEGQVSVHHFE